MPINKSKIRFLDMVIPLVTVYTAFICFWSYFIKGTPKGGVFDVIIVFMCSFFFVYGLLSFRRDVVRYGVRNFFKNWV